MKNLVYQLSINFYHTAVQASLKYLQELGTFLAPQNLTQGRCDYVKNIIIKNKKDNLPDVNEI